jgi:tetratricopeptide (TPR) repeat protein
MLVQVSSGSSQLVESVNRVTQLSKTGKYRSAMEEAFHALQFAPTYLPLHILIGDILEKQNQIPEAVEKFKVIAQSHSIRGETARAIGLYQRIANLSPTDADARKQLINVLTCTGEQRGSQEYLSWWILLQPGRPGDGTPDE